jgi:hypothetical protein
MKRSKAAQHRALLGPKMGLIPNSSAEVARPLGLPAQGNDIKEMRADVIVKKLGGYEWHIGS